MGPPMGPPISPPRCPPIIIIAATLMGPPMPMAPGMPMPMAPGTPRGTPMPMPCMPMPMPGMPAMPGLKGMGPSGVSTTGPSGVIIVRPKGTPLIMPPMPGPAPRTPISAQRVRGRDLARPGARTRAEIAHAARAVHAFQHGWCRKRTHHARQTAVSADTEHHLNHGHIEVLE